MRRLLLVVLAGAAALGGAQRAPARQPEPASASSAVVPAFDWRLPPGFPTPCVPDDNPMTEAKVALGRRLFYEPRLSANGTQSCGSCHSPGNAFTDGRGRAVGSTGMRHPRGSMSLANVAYNSSFTWVDAHRATLEEQQLGPMLNRAPVELGLAGRETDVTTRLAADPAYAAAFAAAFPGEPLDLTTVRKAIASFERTLLSGESPYDRWLWKDDARAMSDAARRGMRLFFSERMACAQCHSGFTFSGPVTFDGLAAGEPEFFDTGLGGPFRAPTLRNVALTAPYMHDGRFATLGEVVDYYARGGGDSSGKSARIRPFAITTREKADLIAFLESLTDDAFLSDPRFAPPREGGRIN
ncbi:MAG TPA: cytochrome c peroxidase [Thermoanaerobaculia bacterium]